MWRGPSVSLNEAMESYGAQKKIEFPNTAYYLPLILAVTGIEVKTLADAKKALEIAKSLLPPLPKDHLWLPYLGPALDAGVATLIAQKILEALKYLRGEEPKGIWLGFTDDAILRTQGIKLVDGRMPGFAACVGALPTVEEAVELARSLQERNILVFMASHTNGVSMAEQRAEAGIEMNWDTFLVPYGKDTSAASNPEIWRPHAKSSCTIRSGSMPLCWPWAPIIPWGKPAAPNR